MKRYIIIGSGPAGATAAETLKKLEPDSNITVITDEKYTFYKRENIIKFVSNSQTEDDLFTKGRDFYNKLGVNLVHNIAVSINPIKNIVKLKNGTQLEYNSLLIASGGKPILPRWNGVDLDGISTLFSLDDAKNVLNLLKNAKKVAIIGLGSIALKTIPLLKDRGFELTAIEKLDRVWPCMLDTKASFLLEKKMKENKVKLLLNREVVGFKGNNGRVNEIQLKDEDSIFCDMVLITIGIKVSLDYLRNSGIKLDQGVLADYYLRAEMQDGTPIQNIFVAGDAAQVPDPLYGTQIVHPTWSYAEAQGETAAYNMASLSKKYSGAVPLHTTDHFNLGIVAAGITQPHLEFESKILFNEFEIYQKLSSDQKMFRKIILRKNKLVGIILIGENLNRKFYKPIVKDALLKGMDLTAFKNELLNDTFDFQNLIKK